MSSLKEIKLEVLLLRKSSDRDYVLCARIGYIPLKYFRFTGDNSYDELPQCVHWKQDSIEYDLTYNEAISRISGFGVNARICNNACSIKRMVDLTQELPVEVDVLCYYIFYNKETEDDYSPVSYPVVKQQLYYQRTNGQLIIFTRSNYEVNENIGTWSH